MASFDDMEQELDRQNDGKTADVYGVLGKEMEVDSDVNEDRNRERQLDASFEDWYRNIGYWVQQKNDLTRVPHDNVFDAMEDFDAEECETDGSEP